MTFDPTTNRIPFGLLSEDEQTELIHWPHGFQVYGGEWLDCNPAWSSEIVYRGKPAPVTITTWTLLSPNGALSWSYGTRREALESSCVDDAIGLGRVDICNGVPSFTFEKMGKGE